MDTQIADIEFRVVEMLRKLRPYGKIEIAMNQTGTELAVTMTNPSRIILYTQITAQK